MTGPAGPRLDGLLAAGGAVVLTGAAAESALQAVRIAIRARRVNGLSDAPAYRALAAALNAARSATGRTDISEHVGGQDFPIEPTVPARAAARQLGVSDRHIRRLAPRLGGRKIAGRWFLDETALAEHLKGTRWES